MSDTRQVQTAVRVRKAQRTLRDQPTPDLIITAVEEMSGADNSLVWQALNMNNFVRDARAVVEAFSATLPGGTQDQILRLMLKRKASQLVVTDWSYPYDMPDYERGRRDGLRALATAVQKVLTPEDVEALANVLRQATEGPRS